MTLLADLDMPVLDFADPATAEAPYAVMRDLAKEHWVARTPTGFALLQYRECVAVSADNAFDIPKALGLEAQGVTEGLVHEFAQGVMLGLKGEQHQRARRLSMPSFTRAQADSLRERARFLLEDILATYGADGRADGLDLNNSYTVRVMCHLLGFPDGDWPQIAVWADAINQIVSVDVANDLPMLEKSILELDDYISEQIERLRANPDDSLGSTLIRAEESGDRFTSHELLRLFQTLLMAGSETTRNQLSIALYLFAKDPAQWEKLAANPELAPSAVDELLRYRPPFVGTTRIALEDTTIRDYEVPAGTFFNIGMASANFDSSIYDGSADFYIERFATSPKPKPHMTFGGGLHVCLGQHLARVELQEAFKLLPQRMPNLRIDEGAGYDVMWNTPYGVHGPCKLPLAWDTN